jgi:hypothetical protein
MSFKVTWQGEAETPDLKETTRFGVVFKKGEAVEIKDSVIARKLAGNKNFKPDGEPPEAPEPLLHPAPSTQSALGPVPKPGEPIREEPPAPPEPTPQKPVNNKLKMPPVPPPGMKKV